MDRRNTLFVVIILLALLYSSLNRASPQPPQFAFGPVIAGDQVVMSWIAVEGAQSYNIYQDGQKIGSVSDLSFTGPLPEEPGTYSYQVSALNISGEESGLSSPGLLQVAILEAPGNLRGEIGPGMTSVYLVWDHVPEAYQYQIYRTSDGGQPALVASVLKNNYHDENIDPGISYGYTVAALDIKGTQGRSSAPILMEIDPQAAAAVENLNTRRRNATYNSFQVEEVLSFDTIGPDPAELSHMGMGPDGGIWVVVPSTGRIHFLDPSGSISTTVDTRSVLGSDFTPHRMDRDEEGDLFVTDPGNGLVAAIDANGGFLWKKQIPPPPETNLQVWSGFPQHYNKLSPSPSSVSCLGQGQEREVWVTDQRLQLVYRYGHDGTFLGYLTHYEGRDGRTWRFRRIGEVQEIGMGRRLITFPLVRKAIVLDENNRVAFEIGEKEEDLSGVFLGVNGVNPMPGDRILLTDPIAGNIQVYSGSDGNYLYHLTWASGKLLGLSRPTMALWGPDGNIWVYEAGSRRITVLRTLV